MISDYAAINAGIARGRIALTLINPANDRCSAAVQTAQWRLGQGMEMQVEPDECSRGGIVLGVGQLVDVNSKNRDLVMMGLIAGRRARAAISVGSEVSTALNGALGHQFLLHVASALGQRRRARRNIEHNPMPPAAAGRRVRIVDADGEAFGPARRATPTQSRRDVAAGAAEALEYLFVDDGVALFEVRTGQGHVLRNCRTRTEHADAKRRDPKNRFCHYNSSPCDMPGFLVAPVLARVITTLGIVWKLKRVGRNSDARRITSTCVRGH